LWSTAINFTPGDGDTVTTDPPRFTWTYVPDPTNTDCSHDILCANWAPHEFVFQISTSSASLNAGSDIFSTTTPFNFYNTIGPLETADGRTFYWRVGYFSLTDANPSSYPPTDWTNPDTWSSATPNLSPSVTWSNTMQFTLASNATQWDRSMLSDADSGQLSSYLAAHAAHPHILFNSSTRTALASWLDAIAGQSWADVKTNASNAIHAASWSSIPPCSAGDCDQLPKNTPGEGGSEVANAAFVWQMTGASLSSSYLLGNCTSLGPDLPSGCVSLPQALVNVANYYVSTGDYEADYHAFQSQYDDSPETPKFMAMAYDWLYPAMTVLQRAQVMHAFDLYAKYITAYFYGSSGSDYCNFSANTDCPYSVYPNSTFKSASSHIMGNFMNAATVALSAYGDPLDGTPGDQPDPNLRWLFNAEINYMIGKTYSFGSEQGMDMGRGYDFTEFMNNDTDNNYLYSSILAQIAFPEARFDETPFWQDISDWLGRMTPVGFVELDEPWGDVGGGSESYTWYQPVMRDLADFTGNGDAYKHYLNQVALTNQGGNQSAILSPNLGGGGDFTELPIPYYFPPPTATVSSVFSKIFPAEGWAFGCSDSSNTAACFQNGVGFVFQARPRGAQAWEHGMYSDLSYQMWAYGVPITDAGDCFGNNTCDATHAAQEQYTIMVNGIGMSERDYEPTSAYYARIFACKGASGCPAAGGPYTYVAADATNAYPIVAYPEDGVNEEQSTGPLGPSGPDLQKVRRHVLFVRNKYFVVFDDLASQNDATYSMLYDVPYLYTVYPAIGYEPDSSPATASDMLKYGNASTTFSYTVGSMVPNDENRNSLTEATTTTLVSLVNDPSTISVVDEHGPPTASPSAENILTNAITGQNLLANDPDDVAGASILPRAHTLWFSNAAPSTSFHFMTVIYPVPPNVATSSIAITRIDDYTVSVVDAVSGTTDIISFNPATAVANNATIVVDLSELTPLPVTDAVTGTTLVSAPYTLPPPATFALSVSASTGGSVSSSPSGISCGSTCSASFTNGAVVTLTATPASGYAF
jgi:hypothetical protein